MRRLISLGTAAMLAMTAPVAVAADAPAGKSAQAKPAAPGTAEFDKQMAQAQENMKKMQEQMEKIRQTQDPQARQKLLQDHWAAMQSNMQLMHGMWGPGMMGCCAGGPMMGMGGMGGHMMGGPMWGDYRRMPPEQLRQRQYMMERYMPMQQMMMDHMMQHQQWMWQPPQTK
jgi:hypothetical protein